MRFLFRCDSSSTIGAGHVSRCVTLGQQLASDGHTVVFLSRKLRGAREEIVLNAGFKQFWITENADEMVAELHAVESLRNSQDRNWDCIVVDAYQLDQAWETCARSFGKVIAVVDDLANRSHDCDVLIDQNFFRDGESRYERWVPKRCTRLIGPKFALINHHVRDSNKDFSHEVRKILVFLGGGSMAVATKELIGWILPIAIRYSIEIHAVMGANADSILNQNSTSNQLLHLHPFYNSKDFIHLLSSMDLFVGSGGTVTWERLAVGLPGMVVATADNQTPGAEELDQVGCQIYLGDLRHLSAHVLRERLMGLIESEDVRREMFIKGRMLVDGLGAQRVAESLLRIAADPGSNIRN